METDSKITQKCTINIIEIKGDVDYEHQKILDKTLAIIINKEADNNIIIIEFDATAYISSIIFGKFITLAKKHLVIFVTPHNSEVEKTFNMMSMKKFIKIVNSLSDAIKQIEV